MRDLLEAVKSGQVDEQPKEWLISSYEKDGVKVDVYVAKRSRDWNVFERSVTGAKKSVDNARDPADAKRKAKMWASSQTAVSSKEPAKTGRTAEQIKKMLLIHVNADEAGHDQSSLITREQVLKAIGDFIKAGGKLNDPVRLKAVSLAKKLRTPEEDAEDLKQTYFNAMNH